MAEPAPSANLYITGLPSGTDEKKLEEIFGPYGTVTKSKALPSQGGKVAARLDFQQAEEAKWIRENLDGNIPEGLAEAVTVRFASTGGSWGGDGGGGKGGGWGKDGGKGGGDWGGKGGGGGWGKDGGKGGPYGGKGGGWGKDGGGKGWGKGFGGGEDTIATLKKSLKFSGCLPGGRFSNDENCLFICNLPPDTSDVDLFQIFSPFGAIPHQGVRAMLNEEGQCRGIGFVNFLEESCMQAAIQNLNGAPTPSGGYLKVVVKRAGKPRENTDA